MKMTEKRWVSLMTVGKRLGCHQMAERSFFIKNWQMPVCARCTGVIIGNLLALIIWWFVDNKLALLICSGFFCLIMLADWLVQYFGIKSSTNFRRLITGIVGGFGLCCFYIYALCFIIRLFTQIFFKQ